MLLLLLLLEQRKVCYYLFYKYVGWWSSALTVAYLCVCSVHESNILLENSVRIPAFWVFHWKDHDCFGLSAYRNGIWYDGAMALCRSMGFQIATDRFACALRSVHRLPKMHVDHTCITSSVVRIQRAFTRNNSCWLWIFFASYIYIDIGRYVAASLPGTGSN